jgi:hypothetical protein
MRFLSTYFSDILDLLRSPTTRKDEEEGAVVENVEDDMEVEDSEDEVLVLEDTTGGQDRESAEVIIYVTVIRLSAGCGSGSAYFWKLDPILEAGSESALELKAGSGSALKSKVRSFRGPK